jgi:dipeptidyl aminopeptidase/acylaminoacyl peptidase
MYNPTLEKKSYTSAKAYSGLFVRHWDTWVNENKNELWYGLLKKVDGVFKLANPGLTRLTGENGNPTYECPVPPFGGTGDFDISHSGIVFVAKDPKLCPAQYTKTNLYYVALKSFTDPIPPAPQEVKTGKLQGYSISPVFSPDGSKVAFARMRNIQYESDKPRLLLLPDVNDLSNVQEFYETENGAGGWDARPEWITWSNDGKELYIGAEEKGKAILWKLPSTPLGAKEPPQAIFSESSVVDAKVLGEKGSKIFVSSTSLVDSSCYTVLDPSTKAADLVSSSSKYGKSFGLSRKQCDEIWFKGAEGYDVHALVMKPSHFDPAKKYPLAFLIHGGPQGAWLDSWSTRWNPAIFAEQGYVAVMPNPTGSTGYGTYHTDAIKNEWGGRPYVDLVKCWEYIAKEMPYVDTDNGVALGASYGGYMISEFSFTPKGIEVEDTVR